MDAYLENWFVEARDQDRGQCRHSCLLASVGCWDRGWWGDGNDYLLPQLRLTRSDISLRLCNKTIGKFRWNYTANILSLIKEQESPWALPTTLKYQDSFFTGYIYRSPSFFFILFI